MSRKRLLATNMAVNRKTLVEIDSLMVSHVCGKTRLTCLVVPHVGQGKRYLKRETRVQMKSITPRCSVSKLSSFQKLEEAKQTNNPTVYPTTENYRLMESAACL